MKKQYEIYESNLKNGRSGPLLQSTGGCFIKGTRVQTRQGLQRIEDIKVGDYVFSRHENGEGEPSYKRVINTFIHNNKTLREITYYDENRKQNCILIATGDHLFWTEGGGWTHLDQLQEREVLRMADGGRARVISQYPVYRTSKKNIGWVQRRDDIENSDGSLFDYANYMPMSSGKRQVYVEADVYFSERPYLEVDVYNLEVEDFHTYYVGGNGNNGIWVHNANCSEKTTDNINTVDHSTTKVEARREIEECFAAGTLVHTKEGLRPIEELKVGDLVLTWPEDMPIPKRPRHPFRLPEEYIYKRVTKTYVHEDIVISHVPLLGTGVGADEVLRVTPNHLVFSEKYGWLPISALKPSYSLIWADFSNASVRRMKHDVERVTVYNIGVEDCHTYFVGEMGLWVHNKGKR